MKPFNLINEPFIPVIRADGHAAELGLLDTLLQAHELRCIHHSSPLAEVALTRLLLALLHRNFPTPDIKAWGKLWKAGQFNQETLRGYFKQWHEQFDLFHPKRPFYQEPSLPVTADELTPLTKLSSEFTAGNNGAIFDHSFDDQPVPISPAGAARRLISYQAYSVGGGVSKPFNYAHSPLIGGYVTCPVGQSLFQTLTLSMVQVNDDTPLPSKGDLPIWEQDKPRSPTVKGTVPRGYLDYLTFQSRQVRLVGDPASQMVTGVAVLQGHKLPESLVVEPFFVYRIDKVRGYVPCRLSPEKAVWRDSEALLNFARTDSPARILAWLSRLRLAGQLPDQPVSLQVIGMVTDKAKVELWRRDRLTLPTAFLEDTTLADHVAAALNHADATDKAIRYSLGELGRTLSSRRPSDSVQTPGWSSSALGVRAGFWSALEPPFARFVNDCPKDPEAALSMWMETCLKTARHVFDGGTSLVETDARSLRAAVLARQTLARQLTKLTPEKEPATK